MVNRVKISVPRGGRFLRYGDTAGKFGGRKIIRLLPAAWSGQFMRLIRR